MHITSRLCTLKSWTDGQCHPYPSHATYCPDLSSSILLYTSALRIRDRQIMFRWLQTSLVPFHRCHLSRIRSFGSQARMERAAGRRGLDSSVSLEQEGRMRASLSLSLFLSLSLSLLTFLLILPSYLPLLYIFFSFLFF